VSGDLVFYGFALLTVLAGFFVVFSRNIVHAGFSLMFTLLGVAGLFAQLGADFLAVTQIIVYIGGVLILILFVVMMTRMPRGDSWPVGTPGEVAPTISEIGTRLMTTHIFPFEFASLVLLVAMIGAAILIRERKIEAVDEAPAEVPAEVADAAEGEVQS